MSHHVAENAIDGVDDDGGGAAAFIERIADEAIELFFEGIEDLGHTAPPAVDRLFAVADAEERMAGPAVRDPLSERAENVPLGERGVLEFVEQQVVEAGVQAKGQLCERFVGAARGRAGGRTGGGGWTCARSEPGTHQVRDVGEQQAASAVLDPVVLHVEPLEQIPRGFGLSG